MKKLSFSASKNQKSTLPLWALSALLLLGGCSIWHRETTEVVEEPGKKTTNTSVETGGSVDASKLPCVGR